MVFETRPEKARIVKEMPIPDGATRGEKVKAVQRFLGFVNYLAKFLPKLSNACEPLRRLTDKDTMALDKTPSGSFRQSEGNGYQLSCPQIL